MINKLNKQQLEAVTSNSKYIRIIAGAGSGKTRVLTTRIGYLIEQQNVYANKILAITFTNKAANEMKERIYEDLGDKAAGIFVSTIHSFCVRVLRQDIAALNYPRNYTIVDSQDQRVIIREAYDELDIDRKQYSFGMLLNYISNNKTALVSVERALELAGNNPIQKTKANVYKFYQDRLRQLYALDFDDLLIFTYRLFKEYPEVLAKWQRKFDYIHVDEFQDVDNIQYNIVRDLVGKNNSLYVVGDPDQTIYTWRGADVGIIMNFEKDFKDAKTIILTQNYRSTSPILKGANSMIINNQNRVKKDLFTETQSDDLIVHYSGVGQEYEANWIANKIEDLDAELVEYKDIAILYRSNYLSRALEKGLLDYKIPYVIYGGTRFYDRQEVKDALSYLRMITTSDDLAFTRVINYPRRGIGNKSLDTIRKMSKQENISMYDVVSNLNVLSGKAASEAKKFVNLIEKVKLIDRRDIEKILNTLLDGSGYNKMLDDANETDRMENLKELSGDIKTYMETHEDGTLEEYLQVISLYTDRQDYDSGSYVQLMTIHAAKGLEFDYVFVAGMSEGIFPSQRTMAEGLDGLEEERRLAYVAYTRAKKQLYLTESGGYDYVLSKTRTPSRFISEIDSNFIRHVGASFENKSSETFPKPKNPQINRIEQFDTSGIKLSDGQKINHSKYGDGIVISVNNGIAEIAFMHPHGIKKIIEGHSSITISESPVRHWKESLCQNQD